MRRRDLLEMALMVLLPTPAQAQSADKGQVLTSGGVETDFITDTAIERLRDSLVFKEKKNGVWVTNRIDDSDWSEIFARFAWVVWGKEPLPDDVRRRTNARANSTTPDIIKKWMVEINVTIMKQGFSVVISKLNDRVREKKTIEALETRIKALETRAEIQKQ